MIHKVEDFEVEVGVLFIRRGKEDKFEKAYCPLDKESYCGPWCALFGGVRIEQYTDYNTMNLLNRKVVHLCHTTLMCEIAKEGTKGAN